MAVLCGGLRWPCQPVSVKNPSLFPIGSFRYYARGALPMINRIRGLVAGRTLAVLSSLGFAVLGLSLAAPLLIERETPILRMSAGPYSTRRHAVAQYMGKQAAPNDLIIKLEANAGSEDCLNLLKAGQLDAAVVSSGVKVPDDDDIMVLGAVQLEAVHILVRKEMAEAGPLSEAVRGKRINIGEKGSTERLLARELLAFARLQLPSASHSGDVVPTEYSKACLIDKCQAILQSSGATKDTLIAELPDCLIVLASMPSPIVQSLVEAADYRIVPLPATRAFLMDNMQDSQAKTTVVEREFLEPTVIPAHSYFTTRGYPAADCETIGVRLLVVAHKSLSDRAVRPLMKTVFEGEFSRRIQPKSAREIATPYAIHPAAVAYLDRDKPLAVEAVMEWFSKGLSIFGAFSAGALSLYSLLRRRKARAPSDYFAEIRRIDQIALGADVDSTATIQPHELSKHLDDRLLELRQELIGDICEGSIKGDQVISNILTLLNDTRGNLHTLDDAVASLSDRPRRTRRTTAVAA
ncbi:MAG: hypothetical protein JNL18_02890 [Planctomycetaceae bacterium]|nr:hypothetical protein [Planctomycetaceae bacterium]